MPQIVKQVAKPRPTTPSLIPGSNGTSAWDMIDSLRLLLYGESGTGKTTIWGTLPGTILALICSGGSKPGELRSIDTPENRKRVTPVIINTVDDYKRELDRAHRFDNKVLDHVSGFQDIVLKEILGIDEIPVQKGWGLAGQQQWGQCTMQCKELLRALLNQSGNIVIVAQERTFGGKEDGGDPDLIKPKVGAAVTPSLCGWLNPACDFVLQTFKRPKMIKKEVQLGDRKVTQEVRGKGVDYCLRTGQHDVFMTKFRITKSLSLSLPEEIVDPSYNKIMAVIRGEK